MSRDIVRDIVDKAIAEKNSLLVKLFEKHGYQYDDMMKLARAGLVHVQVNKTLDREWFFVNGVKVFGIEGRLEFDSELGRCAFVYKEIE